MWQDFALSSSKSWKSWSPKEVRYWSRAVTMEVPSPLDSSVPIATWETHGIHTPHLPSKFKSQVFSRPPRTLKFLSWKETWSWQSLSALCETCPLLCSWAGAERDALTCPWPGGGGRAGAEAETLSGLPELRAPGRAGRGGEPGRGCAASGCARSGSLPNNASWPPSAPGLGALRHRSAL